MEAFEPLATVPKPLPELGELDRIDWVQGTAPVPRWNTAATTENSAAGRFGVP
jgi:hypothetical protein